QLAIQRWRGNRLLGGFFLSSRSHSCRFALTHIYSPGLTGSGTSVEYPLQSFPGKRPETAASESLAEVAELADAHGSGPCTRKGVGVRVPSSAPLLMLFLTRASRSHGTFQIQKPQSKMMRNTEVRTKQRGLVGIVNFASSRFH